MRREAGQLLVSVPVCVFEFASGAAVFAGSADKSSVEGGEIDGGVCFAAQLEPCAFAGVQLLGRAGYLQLCNGRILPLLVLLED